MYTHLPTCVSGEWTVTSLRDSLVAELASDKDGVTLKLYFYAVTSSGWAELRKIITKWAKAKNSRIVVAYIGTDHAITDPLALRRMRDDGVKVRLMSEYQGVFHPKVVWLESTKTHKVWIGSNNLTRDGLLNNIEFAVLVNSNKVPSELINWSKVIDSGSEDITDEMLKSYEVERKKFAAGRSKAKSSTFTWSRKSEPAKKRLPQVSTGDLIVEVMPRETGADGTQLQIPIDAASIFFGINGVGASQIIRFQSKSTKDEHQLRVTVFANRTVRITVSELDYRDRPCVIIFHKKARGIITYEIVPQSIFPRRYSELLNRCINQTRLGSRCWAIA